MRPVRRVGQQSEEGGVDALDDDSFISQDRRDDVRRGVVVRCMNAGDVYLVDDAVLGGCSHQQQQHGPCEPAHRATDRGDGARSSWDVLEA